MKETVSRLLRENQQQLLRERRSVQRSHFVRPVSIDLSPRQAERVNAFSRDLSGIGIGLVCDSELDVGTIATLEIHSISGPPVRLRSDVRWCNPFGRGWYVTGWRFLKI